MLFLRPSNLKCCSSELFFLSVVDNERSESRPLRGISDDNINGKTNKISNFRYFMSFSLSSDSDDDVTLSEISGKSVRSVHTLTTQSSFKV